MYGLTTAHGTVLCFDRSEQRVTHRPGAAVDPADLVCCTSLDEPDFLVGEPDGAWRSVDLGARGPSRATVPRRLRAAFTDGLASFRSALGFVGAAPDGNLRTDGAEAQDWERFGVIERAGLEEALEFCRHDWIRVGSRALIQSGEIRLEHQLALRLGEHVYPFAGNFPRSGPRRLLFRDGWIVDAFVRYRPLVYFVLMGAGPYADQFALATASLVEFGQYQGHVLVITDREPVFIAGLLPQALRDRFSLLRVASRGKIDAVLARLMLGQHAGAVDHAPILYADTDVVFDQPLRPTLEAALLSGRMSAQSERWNELPGSDAAGDDLFRADPIPFRDPIGFNAGIWSMPGGSDSVQVVDAVRLSISRYLDAHGRQSLPWLDQAMSNYVLRKLDCFDSALITGRTRLCQQHGTLDADGAAGFVHFWPVSSAAADRVAAMAGYLDRLRAAAT